MKRSLHPTGLAAATAAYLIWGLLPIFWKLLQHIDAFTIAAHRVIWAAITVGALLVVWGRTRALVRAFADRKSLRSNALAALAIGANFVVFIWAVSNDRVTEVSLGYYINPLLNVFLGWLFLSEPLNRAQWAAVALAAAGVLGMIALQGTAPWVALALATCFGTYGLVRKISPTDAMIGLAAETLLLTPLCLGYLLLFTDAPLQTMLSGGGGQLALILLTGPATAVPLFLFAFGARRLPLGVVGMLMYLAPTLQLILAVWAYGEPFQLAQAVAFGCIWVAIAVFLWQSAQPTED